MTRKRFTLTVVFLLLTFGLTWGWMYLEPQTAAQSSTQDASLPPVGMLFPAFVALALQVFVSKDSAVYFRKYREKPRWIIYGFFLVTMLSAVIILLSRLDNISMAILSGVGNLLMVLWTLLIFRLYGQAGEESFKRAGLQLGNTDRGVRFVLGFVMFLMLQAALNWILGLGEFQGVGDCIAGIPIPRSIYPLGLIVYLLLSIIGAPLGGLAVLFGEEYAWRGFLQSHLMTLGRRRGATLIGLIWGLWHFPIILRGIHTYPPTVVGLLLGTVFFVFWGFVQSYAVLKTDSIWVAAFLHGVVNNVYAFTLTYLVRPFDKIFSFGLGVYGLACLAIVVYFILRDPVWNVRHGSPELVQISATSPRM